MNYNGGHASILHILKYTRRITKHMQAYGSKESFAANYESVDVNSFWLLQRAEHVTKLSEGYRQKHNIIPWAKIHRLRSVPAHHYETLDLDVLWTILTNEIHILHEFVQQQQLPEDSSAWN